MSAPIAFSSLSSSSSPGRGTCYAPRPFVDLSSSSFAWWGRGNEFDTSKVPSRSSPSRSPCADEPGASRACLTIFDTTYGAIATMQTRHRERQGQRNVLRVAIAAAKSPRTPELWFARVRVVECRQGPRPLSPRGISGGKRGYVHGGLGRSPRVSINILRSAQACKIQAGAHGRRIGGGVHVTSL